MTRQHRALPAILMIAVIMLLGTACGDALGLSSKNMSQQYSCNYTANPAQGQKFGDLVKNSRPGHMSQFDVGGLHDWEVALRERNHFVGDANTVLDPNQKWNIPMKCNKK